MEHRFYIPWVHIYNTNKEDLINGTQCNERNRILYFTAATFAEIMVHFNEVEKKAWKKQTVNTFLSRLSQKGFLNIDKSGKRAIYIPSVSSKKFYENYAKEIVDDSYEGSLKNFICAFTKGHKLTGAEKEDLLAYIQTL